MQLGSMGKSMVLAALFLLSSPHLFLVSVARDAITPNQSIVEGQTLISSGGAFELGFFCPGGSKTRYVGIWYKTIPARTVVWVANRDNPLTGSAGVVTVTADGNLSLHDHAGHVLWSTRTSGVSDPVVQLLDTGNLVLTGGINGGDSQSHLWQSFDYPSDTLLPGMKIGRDLGTGLDRRLTSWKSSSDPSAGAYSCRTDLYGELYISNGSATEYRGRPRDGNLISFQIVSTEDEVYYTYEATNSSIITRLVIDPSGVLQRFVWQSQEWKIYWSVPVDQCDMYAQCGAYGVCNSGGSPICKCLRGFVPKSPEDWSRRGGADGCVRRTALDCPKRDGFLQVSGVKLPDMSNATVDKIMGLDECRDGCLKNCSCTAFGFLNEGTGCITWVGDLIDIRDLSNGAGEDLYVRLAASELGSKRHILIIIVVTSSIAILILSTLIYFVWKRRSKHGGMMQVSPEQSQFTLGTGITMHGESKETTKISFSIILNATDNFSDANKLGEGGFGSVYKGKLSDGQEIAVKRLATCSGQGLEEFKTEILLIAKLQHINLVRLLGCYIQREEKILIYEYMPNKSLDLFLFDPAKGAQIDWARRLHIIEGIAQGLLYLHKHSRLRIIHRDLKASNILLDADMNPKISDFGMARIFASNETQAKTIRVVGTYGYMSPEYVAEGLFSIKSDIFSFGVLLLEIISGKRNNGFHYGNFLNLLGYAWVLWKEAKWFELVDPLLIDKCHTGEIHRCIHVALMCVQESAADRPTISDAITMLSSESVAISDPKQPAFFNARITTEVDLPSENLGSYSINETTISVIDGR